MNNNAATVSTIRASTTFGGGGLLLLVLLVYWPSLAGGFVWDDLVLVKKNPLATGELNLRSVWFSADFWLTTIATWIEGLIFGDEPAGYRVVNALFHSSSAILLWRVLKRLKVPGAWLAAALFAVHPVCVASVAWISELKNTLSLPLYLLSFWCYLRFEEANAQGRIGRGRVSYGFSLVCFLGALAAKTSTVMLPVVLIVCAWGQRGRITPRDGRRLAPHFALALIFGLLTIWFQQHGAIQGVTVQTEGFAGRLAGAGMAIWFYLGKALVPLNLSMIYPRWEFGGNKFVSYVPLLLVGGALAGCWRFRKSWGRPALWALGCFGVSLFPVLGFFDMYFMIFSRVSDHFAYLPLMAVTALVAAGVNLIPHRTSSRATGLILMAALAWLTWHRAKVFASDEALGRDTVAKNPQAWNAHNNLACNLAERGDLDPAMAHFAISLQLNPRNASAHRNLGKALALKGRSAEAEPHWRAAIEIKPDDAEARADYGGFLAQNGRGTEAIEQLREAVRLKPAISSRSQLGLLLAGTGQYAEAVAEFRQILARHPDSIEALNNLAWTLATGADAAFRDGKEAVRLAEAACQLTERKQAIPFGTLAAAYAEAGDFTNAVQAAQTAIGLATAAGNTQFAMANQQLIRLYRANRAFHQSPPKAPANP